MENQFTISNPQEIYKGDFEDMLKLGEFEVFSKSQIDSFFNKLGSILEKAESFELEDYEKSNISIAKAEISSFSKFEVIDDEFNKSLKFVRQRQISWDKNNDTGEFMKGETGTYLNTSLNRKLDRVGEQYQRTSIEK